ncbi:MAG: AcrB/AcrD/AcrF family protein [Bacteroidetes bacterium]|nr:MAG: AcrB/AcrD/AcrF family protein [Bacteroidota bacterium]
MKKIISTFVKFPFYANIIIIAIVFGGIFSFMNMKKAFFPETTSRFINISVFYPGASPKEMDEGVTSRIENAVRAIVGVKEITSTSSENFSSVKIESTGQYDINEMLAEVKNAVDGISALPSAAERPLVYRQRSRSTAMFLSLSGDVSLETLKKYAYDIEDDFLQSGVMSQVNLSGYPPEEISVEITEENLLRYQLTFDQIARAIAFNNTDISGGLIKNENREILIRSRKRSVNPDKIGEIILRANPDGSFLRIRDVATIQRKFADVSNYAKRNGKEAVQITVNKLPEEDLEEISDYVKNYAKEFKRKHPEVELGVSFDFLSMLNSRLKLLYRNGGSGLLLVVIMLAIFLNWRLSLWVAWGIPSAFLGTFIFASLTGITINMISLFGMILVVGILVDDGIVIGENIFAHFEKGKSPKRAAIDGTMEVVPAVLTSVLTTIVAFMPLLIVTQGGLEFMYEMGFIVVVSLLVSLLEAFFVLPAHLSNPKVLNRDTNRKGAGLRKKLDNSIKFMRDKVYGRILKLIIKWRWVAIITPVALIIITAGMFGGGLIKATFFPPMTFDFFNVNFAFKPGDGFKKTDTYLKNFDKIVWQVNDELKKEYNDTTDFVDYTFQILGSSFNGLENGSHAGSIMVGLRDMEGAPVSSFDIRNRIKKKLGKHPELEKLNVEAQGGRFGKPVSITLLGKDYDRLIEAKKYFEHKLSDLNDLINVTDDNATGKPELLMELKPKAYFLGLNQNMIAGQIRQGFYGDQAQRLQSGKDELRIWVRYPKSGRLTIGQFENTKIKTAAGEFPVSELINYKIKRGPVQLKHYQGNREITVTADLADPDTPVPPILENIKQTIVPEFNAKFPGIKIDYQGQAKRSNEAMAEIMKFFTIAFIFIVLILILHFKSVWQALIVLMMIPLGWLGAVWGHGIEGHAVSMLSAWGMVALSGVIINDAVVFLSKYNSLLLEGMKVKEAVFEAGLKRFRPIVLTTITTAGGLYPIIMENSFQAQMLIPMAIALAYGVLVGTAFILMFFPVLILCLNDIKVGLKTLWTGVKPQPEEVEKSIIHSKISID